MTVQQYISATIVEVESITVEIVEKEPILVTLQTVDMIQDRSWVVQTIKDCFVYNEVPTKVNSKKFRADNSFISKTLQVFLNGIKEKYITVDSSTDFSFAVDTITGDEIEISYIKS